MYLNGLKRKEIRYENRRSKIKIKIIELDVEVPDKSSYNKFDDYDPNFKRLIQKAIAYNPRKTKNKG